MIIMFRFGFDCQLLFVWDFVIICWEYMCEKTGFKKQMMKWKSREIYVTALK